MCCAKGECGIEYEAKRVAREILERKREKKMQRKSKGQ
jgi:hypothetical protein